jgi:FkbM family methyltransferase
MSTALALDDATRELRRVSRKYGWIGRIRPQSLAEPLYRLFGPYERRHIATWRNTRLFIDPFSHFGQCLVRYGDYESEQCDTLRRFLPPGGSFLDIGANEGVFSALAAGIIGRDGLIIAVEPQSRVYDIARVNIALNHQGQAQIIKACISEMDRSTVVMSLGPISNTGGSSIVNAYRWSTKTETVETRSLDSIVDDAGRETIDLMKVDVEGYEPEVILSGERSIKSRRIKNLAVDYHYSILQRRGKSANETHASIVAAGYKVIEGDPSQGGYVIYCSPN